MAENNPGVKKGAPWGQYIMAYHCGGLPKGKKFDPLHLLTGEGFRSPPLGPGLYFSDNLIITRLYCTYVSRPTITTARLNMRGVFWGDGVNGAPGSKERKAYKILRENFARWGVSSRPPYDLWVKKNGFGSGGDDVLNAIKSLHESIPIKDAFRRGKAAQKQIRKYGPLYSKLYEEEGRTDRVARLEDKVHALGFSSMLGMGHAKANRVLVGLGIKGLGVRIRSDALEISIFDPENIEVLDARRTSVRRANSNPTKKKVAKKKAASRQRNPGSTAVRSSTTKSGNKVVRRFETEGGYLEVWENSPHAQGSNSVVNFEVDNTRRGQGIGSRLVDAVLAAYPGEEISAQVSSLASLKVFFNKGFTDGDYSSFGDLKKEWEYWGGSLNVRNRPASNPKRPNKRANKKTPWSGRDIKGMQEFADRKLGTKKKVAKKKAARKKTPPYQLLINRCAKLWDHYCERPSKARLKPVLEHLEKMKASASKRVADERKACLRVANKEARRLKMK